MQAIEIKNMSFSYRNIVVFDDFNLNIPEGRFISILGNNGSGKTTLVNILSGMLKFKGNILVFGRPMKKDIVKKEIVTVFDDVCEYDSFETVMDLLVKSLKKNGAKNIKDKIIELAAEFDFTEVLNTIFNVLPLEKRKLVILGMKLAQNPKVLILDNLFEEMNREVKNKILKILKKEVKRKKLTVINVSNDVEEALYADMVVIIGDGKVLLKGSKRKVFENETFFESYDLKLPFIVNLSNKLKFYELVDKIYFDEKKLVDDLWE